MQKWEYLRVILGLQPIEELNGLGVEGWELVTTYDDYFYFKRPLLPVNALGDEQELSNVENVELPDGYWSNEK